jgi:hypothetical protein
MRAFTSSHNAALCLGAAGLIKSGWLLGRGGAGPAKQEGAGELPAEGFFTTPGPPMLTTRQLPGASGPPPRRRRMAAADPGRAVAPPYGAVDREFSIEALREKIVLA